MCSSMIGPGNIFSASIKAMDVKVHPAGLMTMPAAPASIASWIQSMSCASLLVWRNSSGRSPASLRHIASISAKVVRP